MRHDDDERRLPQERRFTRHVGAGNHDDLLMVVVEHHAVGDVAFARGHLPFDNGVPALLDVDGERVVYVGAYIVVFLCRFCKGQQAVDTGDEVGVELYGRYVVGDRLYQIIEKLRFEGEDFFFCSENFFFVFFQLLCDVTFGTDERLFANPLFRNFVFVCVAYLDVVAEDVVISYFEAGNARPFAFPLLQVQEVIFSRTGDFAEFVEFGVHAFGDDSAPVGKRGGIG